MWCSVASVYTEQCPPGWCCGNGHPHSQGLQKCLIVNVALKFSRSKRKKTLVLKQRHQYLSRACEQWLTRNNLNTNTTGNRLCL